MCVIYFRVRILRAEFDACAPAFDGIGRATYISAKPGTAQTMKLVHNLIAASSLAVTAVAQMWESALASEGPESDFTSIESAGP